MIWFFNVQGIPQSPRQWLSNILNMWGFKFNFGEFLMTPRARYASQCEPRYTYYDVNALRAIGSFTAVQLRGVAGGRAMQSNDRFPPHNFGSLFHLLGQILKLFHIHSKVENTKNIYLYHHQGGTSCSSLQAGL